jgi:hypothetical protein
MELPYWESRREREVVLEIKTLIFALKRALGEKTNL